MCEREKVIKGLECCTAELGNNQHRDDFCKVCPYKDKDPENWYCFHMTDLMRDALALLKAQEPQIVEERADTDTINCPKCGQRFARVGRDKSIYLDTDEEPNYCSKCGQAVKWE